jgi:hypothetical protein
MLRLLRNAVVSTLVCAAALWAADPFAGIWKLNTTKSTYKQGKAPKEQTVTIADAGDELVTKVDVVNAGKSISYKYRVPAKGGDGTAEAPDFDTVRAKRLGERERQMLYLKGQKEVRSVHARLSPDAKTMTVDVKGVDALGQPVEGTVLFEKQ